MKRIKILALSALMLLAGTNMFIGKSNDAKQSQLNLADLEAQGWPIVVEIITVAGVAYTIYADQRDQAEKREQQQQQQQQQTGNWVEGNSNTYVGSDGKQHGYKTKVCVSSTANVCLAGAQSTENF
ncbi:MAG: hypothetical protein MJ211_05570 [Bacteroidales bacterium]|nr:hypothetical protein [Bacteroidales bacterium]